MSLELLRDLTQTKGEKAINVVELQSIADSLGPDAQDQFKKLMG